jgi:hypothetical protein
MNPIAVPHAVLTYLQAVLETYVLLPQTPARPRPLDRRLALQLHQRGVPLQVVQSALWLAAARRAMRPPDAPPLAPIRSLYYFLPVIEEVLENPLPTDYICYLQSKLTMKANYSKGRKEQEVVNGKVVGISAQAAAHS